MFFNILNFPFFQTHFRNLIIPISYTNQEQIKIDLEEGKLIHD